MGDRRDESHGFGRRNAEAGRDNGDVGLISVFATNGVFWQAILAELFPSQMQTEIIFLRNASLVEKKRQFSICTIIASGKGC